MTLNLRSASTTTATTKGAALTHAEMDANWLHVLQSANQEFVQSGTGAIARTMQEKAREIERTPQDHDAAADGTTDDRTAFANAIASQDAESNGEIKVPAETYKLVTGITMPTFNDLVGAGRWATRLEFALTATGTCVNLEGADTNNRVRSTLRKMRIDGTNCTDSAVTGVSADWNQQQQPILDEVTIYGGYESGGASTGLKHGFVLKTSGTNSSISVNELAIEGCFDDQLKNDTSAGGGVNIFNFWGGRIQNGKTRNVVIIGPNDDTTSFQYNFYGTTIEKASLANTGVASNVHLAGVKANFNECWFEAGASPNWPTHEIRLETGRASFHNCHWAWAQTAMYVGGTAVLSGYNTIRSSTAGIHIASTGTLVINGEAVDFLGAGTPITFDAGAKIFWPRNKFVQKTASYTVTTADIGCEFNTMGAVAAVTFTIPAVPEGATFKFVNGGITIRNSAYVWTLSGSGTSEYYLTLAGGGDPGLANPSKLYDFATSRTKGTVGALNSLEWGYGDNDTLGFSTVYYRSSDPDSQSANTVVVTYPLVISPSGSSNRIIPLGTSVTDTITSDGTLGASIELVAMDNTFFLEKDKSGTWT